MRKLIVSIHSTLNGVVSGPPDDPTNFMTWIEEGGLEDTSEDFARNFDTVDTVLMGRNTYEDLARKWPVMSGALADIINKMPKLVVGNKRYAGNLKWGDFEDPRLLPGSDIENRVRSLKEQAGGDIITFGSPTLVQSLVNANLVDEFRLLVHPVVVGEDGRKRLFENVLGEKPLTLLSTQTFKHGAMLLCYARR